MNIDWFWPPLITFDYFWPLLATFDQLQATFGNFEPLFAYLRLVPLLFGQSLSLLPFGVVSAEFWSPLTAF